MCRPAWRTGVSASPCLNAEGQPAGKSTGQKRSNVSGRIRLFQNVSEPSDAAAASFVQAGWRWPAGLHGSAILAKTK